MSSVKRAISEDDKIPIKRRRLEIKLEEVCVLKEIYLFELIFVYKWIFMVQGYQMWQSYKVKTPKLHVSH